MAVDILYELLNDWGESHNVLRRIPSELLAHCFTFLPLRDRITASHVSRSWRSSALSHPVIWADLSFSNEFPVRSALLEMALARTGHLPLHLRSQDFYILDAPAISACLETCFHRLRFVSWSTVRVLPLARPAPTLQTFIGQSIENITLRSDFLGGVAGVLHTLDLSAVSFPSVCPALSTVTHLTLDIAYDAEQAATLGRLFDLFSALKFLSLSGLHSPFAHLLPRGPAPPSLVELRLVSRDPEYDLAPHYFDWRTTNLRDAFLTQARIPAQFNRLCAGAVNLALHRDCELQWSPYSDDRMRIVATDAAGRRCSIEFEDLVTNNHHLRDDIIWALRGLRAMRALEVPLQMAGALGPLIAVLPSLVRLTLRVSDSRTAPRRAWRDVLSLARALDESESASRLEVVVFPLETETRPPYVQDVQGLLDHLAIISGSDFPNVRVEGCDIGEMVGLRVPMFERFSVEFVPA